MLEDEDQSDRISQRIPMPVLQNQTLHKAVTDYNLSLIDFYEKAGERPPGQWGMGYRRLLAHYYNQMIPQSASILEVGCGGGELLAMLNGKTKTGIDLSPTQIERAKRRLPGVNFEVGAAETFAPGKTYDIIILSDTLNHAADCQVLLASLLRVAHANSRLLINIFNSLWQPVLNLARSMGIASPVPGFNWLSRDDVRNFLDLSGWEQIRCYGKILFPSSTFLPARLINRWVAPCLPWCSLTLFVVARLGEVARQGQSLPKARSVSIIVPARNEAGNVEDAVRRVPQMSADQEWIFVEGGSSDGTWQALEKLPGLFPDKKISFLKQTGKGKANAVREGFQKATGDIFMILDADLTMPPEELPKYYEAIVGGKAEFANGVRLVYPMDKKSMPFLNLCVNKLFAILFSWLLEQPIKDTLCGTKVLLKSEYRLIEEGRAHFGDFDPFGDFDLLFGAAKLNLKIVDIPIRYKERTYGQTNIRRWRHGAILVRMALFGATRLKFV